MAVISAILHPVTVTARPLADSAGYPYQQPPTGIDPVKLRVLPARDVREGDWYMGDCEQPTPARRGHFWGVHSFVAFKATPVMDTSGETLAMDGESFVWNPDELVMVIVGAEIPAAPGHTATPQPALTVAR